MSPTDRRAAILRSHAKLSLTRQCQLLSISRSSIYYEPVGESPETLALMHEIDRVFTAHPFFGSRQIVQYLAREGTRVGRHRVRRLMQKMGLEAVYRRPKTSQPHPQHPVYPYLLGKMEITRPGQVWCADITFIPVRRGFLYLVAIMGEPFSAIGPRTVASATRKVLAWRLSNSLDASFCLEALEEALAAHEPPEIMNTDQGSQFTGTGWITLLKAAGVRISMDGRGRCMDNIFIDRLWRSLKHEAVYLIELTDGFHARRVIDDWMAFYNARRPHSALGGATADEAYGPTKQQRLAA